MTGFDVRLYRYQLPFHQPLTLGQRRYTCREGILLKFTCNDRAYWTEIAPLPGFSAESLVAAVAQVRTLLTGGRIQIDQLANIVKRSDLFPSVRCGLEMLYLKLPASLLTDGFWLPSAGPSSIVMINALVTGRLDEISERAVDLGRKGFRAVKLKVGGREVAEDIARVKTLIAGVGPSVQVRLDANRAWTLAEARQFGEGIAGLPIAYLEEPLRDAEQLPQLGQTTALPLAWDETTRERVSEVAAPFPALRAVILKPMLLGGIRATDRWIDWAERQNIQAVISASFESGCGLASLVEYVARLGRGDTPSGFDTLRFFANDTLRSSLPIDEGAWKRAAVREVAEQLDECRLIEETL